MEHIFYITKDHIAVRHHATEAPVIAIKYGERGFYPIFAHGTPAQLNQRAGWTADEIESAVEASMFGWHTPAARLAREAVERRELASVKRGTTSDYRIMNLETGEWLDMDEHTFTREYDKAAPFADLALARAVRDREQGRDALTVIGIFE